MVYSGGVGENVYFLRVSASSSQLLFGPCIMPCKQLFSSIHVVDICCFACSASALCFFWQERFSFPWGTIPWDLGGLTLFQHGIGSSPGLVNLRTPVFPCDWQARDLVLSGVFVSTGAVGEAIWVSKPEGGSLGRLVPSCHPH